MNLDELEKRNLGCHQCEEGRPHTHRPDETPVILNETVQKLIAELRAARKVVDAVRETIPYAEATFGVRPYHLHFVNLYETLAAYDSGV